MLIIFQKKIKLIKWLEKMLAEVVDWGEKSVRKLKGKPPEKTAWQIIKLLA